MIYLGGQEVTMSSQGKASNDNGRKLEKQIADLFTRHRILHQHKVVVSVGPKPRGQTHDFRARINDKQYVIDCKYHSGMPGTIWEKIPHALNLLAYNLGHKIMVLGGERFDPWQEEYLRGCGEQLGIQVITFDELEELVGKNSREPDQHGTRPNGPLSNGPALDAVSVKEL